MRALVVLCLVWCASAYAQPKYKRAPSASADPAMVAAERKWAIAAASRGPAQSDLWEDAASAFVAVVDAGTLPKAELAEAARAALLAFKNALHVDPRVVKRDVDARDNKRAPAPRELSSRDQRMMHLLDVAGRYETRPDEVAGIAFFRANLWRRYEHHDKASPIYLEIIEKYPRSDVAVYSANLLLDSYNRAQRYDELVALASKLRRDKKFLAGRADFAHTVELVYAAAQSTIARDAAKRASETGDRRLYETCAEAYLAILDGADRQRNGDEVLHNAMTCFELAGNIERALTTLRELSTKFPDSQLARRAELRSISLLGATGRFEDAANAGARWLRTNPLERDAADVLEDTVRWLVALGSLDIAVRVLDDYTSRAKRVPLLTERRAAVAVTLAASILDDARTRPAAEYTRRRAIALRILARPPPLSRMTNSDGPARVAIARTYATAACPIPTVDGLCTRPRDAALMATARRELARLANPSDGATLLVADLALEQILASRAPTANLSADYEHLTRSSDPDVRLAAHARLAALARHAGDDAARTKHLEACVAEGRVSRGGDTWRTTCERELALDRDALPRASAPAPLALEPALIPPPPAPPPSRAEVIDF